MKSQKKKRGIFYYVLVIILLIAVVYLYNVYQTKNFNQFNIMEYHPYTSIFSRDKEIKCSKAASYKIQSDELNDAMYVKTIEVQKNTPYKVTCKVKTQDVKSEKEYSSGGAQISITNTVEKSESILGTNDWQEIELLFNSKNRTSVDIGFRLGGYDDNCTGTAWFSDFKVESGMASTSTNWNVACFIFTNIDVTVNANNENNHVKVSMTQTDIQDIKDDMERFKNSCRELSGRQMTVTYDCYTIESPVTSLSYDEDNAYFVGPENVADLIKPYLQQEEYEHIFVAVRLGDALHKKDIKVNDWIGLGGMDYLGIGFSNIRLPNENNNYIYKYNERVNTFPEEVFIHEFLHTLERNIQEYGYTIPALHDYEKYGYKDERLTGQKNWYQDYMRKNIDDGNGNKIGLDSVVYQLKPTQPSYFEFSMDLGELKEPANIIEEIRLMINRIVNNVENIKLKKEENAVQNESSGV